MDAVTDAAPVDIGYRESPHAWDRALAAVLAMTLVTVTGLVTRRRRSQALHPQMSPARHGGSRAEKPEAEGVNSAVRAPCENDRGFPRQGMVRVHAAARGILVFC